MVEFFHSNKYFKFVFNNSLATVFIPMIPTSMLLKAAVLRYVNFILSLGFFPRLLRAPSSQVGGKVQPTNLNYID